MTPAGFMGIRAAVGGPDRYSSASMRSSPIAKMTVATKRSISPVTYASREAGRG